MTHEQMAGILQDVASRLGEHFDTVQILATSHDERGTFGLKAGVGNWYARQGQAREFIQQETARHHAVEIDKIFEKGD